MRICSINGCGNKHVGRGLCNKHLLRLKYNDVKDKYNENRRLKYKLDSSYKDKVDKRNTNYYRKNREDIIQYKKEWYNENKEQLLDNMKEYRKNNIESIRINKREYKKNVQNKKIESRIKEALRARVRDALFRKNGSKNISSMKLIGCSIIKLKKHLESKFKDGMTWDNYGLKGWHIDHVVPCNAFDLTKENEQLKCFNYSNLQPLWWFDNLQKGERINNGIKP